VWQTIDQSRYRLPLPRNRTRNLHAMTFIESACDRVLCSHAEVQIAARWLHDLVHELPEDSAARAVELVTIENLVQHDRPGWNLHIADAGSLPILLVRDDNTVLIDALAILDAALERILPDVREHVPVGLEMPVDRFEIAETRVAHGYFFLNTNTGSDLKALFGVICFSPTIIES